MSRSFDYLSSVLSGAEATQPQPHQRNAEDVARLSCPFDNFDAITAAAWQEIVTRARPGKRTPRRPFKSVSVGDPCREGGAPAPVHPKRSEA